MPSMNVDVIILGAGALGVSTAYHLASRGIRVLVLEREMLPACHASGKNAGMIRQLYRHEQLTDWTTRSIRDWPDTLKKSSFRETGSYVVGRRLPDHHSELFEERIVRVNGKEPGMAVSVYCPTDGLLDSPRYVNDLAAHAKQRGATFAFKQHVTLVDRMGARLRVQTALGESFEASWVVNAAGPWLNDFLHPELGASTVAAAPFARHLFVVNGFPDGYMPEPDCGFYWNEADSWYMRRWDANTRLISICDRLPATPESFVPDPSRNEKLANVLLSALPEVAPALRIERSWHCFRTYTDDQLPVWGEDPAVPGLFWLAAFGGFGMSTSFAAGMDAAKHISGEAARVIPDFLPTRFHAARKSSAG
ncbi:MAG: FAD-dependent oxidoreductase [Bdellovibrionota bacterium]